MPSYLARIGVTVFAILFATVLLTERPAAGRALAQPAASPEATLSTHSFELPALREIAPVAVAVDVPRAAVAGFESPVSVAAAAPVTPVVRPAVPAGAAAPPVQRAESDAVVLASWYGPGFYGNRTACGQIYTPEILGVAHLTLPCGTRLTLTYGARTLTVTVIDRGPYVAGRTLDLSNATKIGLGCTDLCTLRMQLGR